jgi:N-acetylglutamate synthase-like GNAT family acetyltransferase
VEPSPEIARALPGEHAAILELHREAGWPGTQVEGEVWAAQTAGQLVGSIQVIVLAPGLMLIDAVVVRDGARDRGIGAAMVRTVLATRTAEWWLECREERIAFYERLGFAVAPGPAVPPLVLSRVGANTVRSQHFLRISP